MSEKFGFPVKSKGTTKAGITIHLDPGKADEEPLDITLYIKKPRDDENAPDPDDENSFTAAGKLLLKFGKRRSLEIFAENISRVVDGGVDKTEDEV